MADCKDNNEESSNGPKPPIIMKFDAPDESSENSTNEEAEEQLTDNTDSSTKRSSAFKYFSKASLLRPSQLNAVLNTTSGSSVKPILKPARFHNPFTATVDNSVAEEVTSSTSQTNKNEETKEKESKENQLKEKELEEKESKEKESSEKESKEKESSNQDKVPEEVAPKFFTLGTSSTKENDVNNSSSPSASTQSFVFGQNLKERVAVAHDADSSDNSEKEESKIEEPNENGSSELLFSNAATACKTSNRSGLTLSEAAQELEEATRASKRKYNQVTLLTGEEGETNVLQINCKLFAFDKATSGWQERGRGSLRLNDMDEESRLVGRTAGTQRLVLNTKVWPGMTAERASPKSLRLTAMDANGDVRIFVIQAAPKEIDQLDYLLLQRLKRAQERQPKKFASDH